MTRKKLLYLISVVAVFSIAAQDPDPQDYYYEMPDYPSEYTGGTVAGRMIDGLGFRYYWATAGLTEQDLTYRPTEEARNVEETIEHILALTDIVLKTTTKETVSFTEIEGLSFAEKRNKTLDNLKLASERIKQIASSELDENRMVFSEESAYPFWNLLNGPLADAIYHVGQVVSFRRISGNPINPNISVLSGKLRN